MAENVIQRIRYIQNRSRFWSISSLYSPGLTGFNRVRRYRFRILKPFQPNAAQAERWRYFESRRKRRGLLFATAHLSDELAGYHGRVPFLLNNTADSSKHAKIWDFYILEPSEVKTKAMEFAKELVTAENIAFWPYLSKKLVQFRGVLPINDLVECLGCLRSADYYDPFLLKVVVREIVQDFKKLTMESVAIVLHTYMHFNCSSTALSEAVQQHLHAVLLANNAWQTAVSAATLFSPVLEKISKQSLPYKDGSAIPSLSGYAFAMFLQFFLTFKLNDPPLLSALLAIYISQHSSLTMVHLSDVLMSLSLLLQRFPVEDSLLHHILSLAEKDGMARLSISSSHLSEETLDTRVSYVYSLAKLYESGHTALPLTLRIQCISSLLTRMQEECANDLSFSFSWEDSCAIKKPLFDALYPHPPISFAPFCKPPEENSSHLGETKISLGFDPQSALRRDVLTNCIGKSLTSLGIMWKLQALFPQKIPKPTDSVDLSMDKTSFQDSSVRISFSEKKEAKSSDASPILIEMARRGIHVSTPWWNDVKSYADMYTQMTKDIHPVEQTFVSTALFLIYIQGCGSLSATLLCNIFELMALHRCSYGKEQLSEEGTSSIEKDPFSSLHPFDQVRDQLLHTPPSVATFSSPLEDQTNAPPHHLFFIKEMAWEITRKLKSLKPMELYRLYLAMYNGHCKEPYLLHSLYKFPSFMRISAIRSSLRHPTPSSKG